MVELLLVTREARRQPVFIGPFVIGREAGVGGVIDDAVDVVREPGAAVARLVAALVQVPTYPLAAVPVLGRGIEFEDEAHDIGFFFVDVPALADRVFEARLSVRFVRGVPGRHEFLDAARLGRVAEGGRAATRFALGGLAALHLADALGSEVDLELGSGSENLQREAPVCALVVVLVAEVPELDPMRPENVQETALDLVAPPQSVGVPRADAKDAAGRDVVE
ncbi:hypothetical protein POL67_17580 [Polyangium sp. rjm3]|uniref:Uncharacterized protein n=1 Tax=Polyangium mundeleinium TaxID=2995306 RepID=A0ABT5EMV0_9BACT|nr:hypothetical protein [Polyangium mundeleinium]MDC0743165.1 hypothetical protein [Polyangium mundeleinium]